MTSHSYDTLCGLDPARYKGHSFRVGAASYAVEQGLSDSQIRTLGSRMRFISTFEFHHFLGNEAFIFWKTVRPFTGRRELVGFINRSICLHGQHFG